MADSIIWKEAENHQEDSDNEEVVSNSGADHFSGNEITNSKRKNQMDNYAAMDSPLPETDFCSEDSSVHRQDYQNKFDHRQLDLRLMRNITALADPAQHKPKLEYDSQVQTFEKWIEPALIAISPNADTILFASHDPDKMLFISKLRMEPVNQYSTRTLEVPLDHQEQITSLLCIPIMSSQRTSLGSVDWTVLLIGFSSGYVKFYTEQSICLISLKFCDEPVMSLKLQTQKINSNARSLMHFPTTVDELFISYKSNAIILDGIGLFENLRISKEDVTRNGPCKYEPAYTSVNLPAILTCQRWRFSEKREAVDADVFGIRCVSKFDILKSDSINTDYVPPKSLTRTIILIGRNPFISCYKEARDATTHSYTEMLSSLLPFWSKPQPSRVQIHELNCSSSTNIFDKERLATSIVPSPDRRLAAITDDYGRVMLVDITNWLVVRIWKGYRNAQCGWVEVKRNPEERNSPYASFLVIYAPKRGSLEIWSSQRGPRVAAFNVGKSCRLLYTGYKMLNMRAESSQKGISTNSPINQSYSTNCYILNAKSETIFSIELPYTFSLYKYSDFQSRDRLLISELIRSVQQDADVNLISETLHRISLVESHEKSIQKITMLLLPTKIVPIMENLINKIMKNYDNHSGETMSNDDQSIIELAKRIIRLCSMFDELTKANTFNISLPDVGSRFMDHYEEHPDEIDEFAEHLGWAPTEVLRYLSLLALERSYRRNHIQNPWPNLGEPLTWSEFVDCFDLKRMILKQKLESCVSIASDKISIKLKEFSNEFLTQEKVIKTALFMFNKLCGSFFEAISSSSKTITFDGFELKYLEPSSRLVLFFQFWLSTNLSYYWKMWPFLQIQVGHISDELKVIAMTQESDQLLVDVWKRIYYLILESDNVYSAIIATAAIRSDTLRMINDNEKRDKLKREDNKTETDGDEDKNDEQNRKNSSIDWECLCVDAERMSLLIQQLEDVFLLNLLLKYSPADGYLLDKVIYRVPRISVANILRSGPTIVSELVAQWAVQFDLQPKIFNQPYGIGENECDFVSMNPTSKSRHWSQLHRKHYIAANNEEHAKELLHHTKTSFPRSLEPNVILLNCVWEFCNSWNNSSVKTDKDESLNKALDCLSLLETSTTLNLKYNSACLAYKTFFQQIFERVVSLIETNSTILSTKCSRSRDTISRRELHMSEDCLEAFVHFCHKLSDFMLETYRNTDDLMSSAADSAKLKDDILSFDDWWSALPTEYMDKLFKHREDMSQDMNDSFLGGITRGDQSNSLLRTAAMASNLFDLNNLIELNRLTSLMLIIFRLKLIRIYPLSLIGEESRRLLKLDIKQSPMTGADMKTRSGLLHELRQKFARKSIVGIVSKLSYDYNVFEECDDAQYSFQSSFPNDPDDHSVDAVANKNPLNTCRLSSNIGGNLKAEWDSDVDLGATENNECMTLFTHLLSLANEWQLDRDELHMELVFELFRCNHDKLALQVSNRIQDKLTLANGLLKISSQRVLVLFGLSSQFSSENQWLQRVDKWSFFQPSVSSWLRSIQEEETKREIASLVFPENALKLISKMDKGNGQSSFDLSYQDFESYMEHALGLRLFVVFALKHRTKSVLETITNYLEGQANRLSYDLLQLLESQSFDSFLREEKKSWSSKTQDS